MDIRVQDLRYFVAVADELSFTRAAEALFVSQPALSKQIRRLEAALGARLLDRDRRTVALTEAGAVLLPRARQMVRSWCGAEAEIAALAATGRTTLTVGFQTRIGRGLIPAITTRMREALPGWRLVFRQVPWHDPTAGLARGETDVAIAWLPVPADGTYAWKVVSTEDRWVALPGGHRLAEREVVPFRELEAEPFLALPASAGPTRDFWLATGQRDCPPRIAAEAVTAEEAMEGVAAGLGVTLIAAGDAEINRRDDVVCRPVEGLPPSRLAVVWRAVDERPAVRLFAEACVRCLCA
ncbi:LysR family transcriptional regulator [Amycolatopsis rhizosphaerae]|uniref:LysR family transcriptional regulator n=1 Tax=Amycolatopsis rhizosphaerae TaxID=2053003 RepID=A0A558CVK6_9PSEU|nr:LysR family transcriptional regulator [Amycolatopsis rhizosphaerae]TVT52772.1 LysR family transcriptional regulator [Amycolatopsis rhizosphaerae]